VLQKNILTGNVANFFCPCLLIESKKFNYKKEVNKNIKKKKNGGYNA